VAAHSGDETLSPTIRSDFLVMDGQRPQQEPQVIVPPGAPGWVSESLVRITLETWQPFTDRPLTSEDAVAMLIRVGELFDAVGLTKGDER
jgi:hypothetical protein